MPRSRSLRDRGPHLSSLETSGSIQNIQHRPGQFFGDRDIQSDNVTLTDFISPRLSARTKSLRSINSNFSVQQPREANTSTRFEKRRVLSSFASFPATWRRARSRSNSAPQPSSIGSEAGSSTSTLIEGLPTSSSRSILSTALANEAVVQSSEPRISTLPASTYGVGSEDRRSVNGRRLENSSSVPQSLPAHLGPAVIQGGYPMERGSTPLLSTSSLYKWGPHTVPDIDDLPQLEAEVSFEADHGYQSLSTSPEVFSSARSQAVQFARSVPARPLHIEHIATPIIPRSCFPASPSQRNVASSAPYLQPHNPFNPALNSTYQSPPRHPYQSTEHRSSADFTSFYHANSHSNSNNAHRCCNHASYIEDHPFTPCSTPRYYSPLASPQRTWASNPFQAFEDMKVEEEDENLFLPEADSRTHIDTEPIAISAGTKTWIRLL